MNLANQLTILRFFLTIGFVLILSVDWHFSKTIGLTLFIVAAITDYLDGVIARRYNLISDFGKLMDPLIDKIMMASAFICLIPLNAIPPWAVIIIISREFLITGLRLLALSKGKILPAESLGKHKTAWQITTVIFFLLMLSLKEILPPALLKAWWSSAWSYGGVILITCALLLTLYSGFGYLRKNWHLVSEATD